MTLQQIEQAVISEFSKEDIVAHLKSVQCKVSVVLNCESIRLKCRNREVLIPRQVCFFFANSFLTGEKTLTDIGQFWGGFDHATVLHSKAQILNLMDSDGFIRSAIYNVEKELILLLPEINNKKAYSRYTTSDAIKHLAYKLSEKNIVSIKNELIKLANSLK